MSEYTYTVPAGMFKAASKAEANALAEAYARSMAKATRFCCDIDDVYLCSGQAASDSWSINLGTGPFQWLDDGNTLPAGLSMVLTDNGRTMSLNGAPTTAGNYAVHLELKDTFNNAAITKDFNIYVIGILENACADAQVGVPYSQQLTAVGGSGSYFFEVTLGALPDGLTLSSEGLISGTPTTAGTSIFQISLSDQRQNVLRQVTATMQAVLLPCLGSGLAEEVKHVYEIVNWDSAFATLPAGYSNPLSPGSWGPDRVWHGNLGTPIAAPAFYWEAGLNYVFPDGTFCPNVAIQAYSIDGSLAYPNKPIAFYRLFVWISKDVVCTGNYIALHPGADAAQANNACLPVLWIGRLQSNVNTPEGTFIRESGLMSLASLQVRLVS